MKLNIGCEFVKRKDCINIDVRKDVGADVLCDVTKLAFKDNSIDSVYMHNLLEHISDTLSVMEEVYRVCKHGAFVDIVVPHFSSRSAWATPDHVKAFALNSFWNFMPNRTYKHYNPVFINEKRELIYSKSNMIIDRIINWFARKFPDTFERRFLYWFGGCDEVRVLLRVKKM